MRDTWPSGRRPRPRQPFEPLTGNERTPAYPPRAGDHTRHRLSGAGNRRINRVLHNIAAVSLRNDTEGRRCYRRKLSAGTTPMEAMHCLKRRLSDQVHRQVIHDVVAAGDGSGGHMGASLQSSAARSIPTVGTSEKSHAGPARTQRRTPASACS